MDVRLPKHLEELAIEILNENPKQRDEDVKYIRNWLKEQSYLNARTDYLWILNFLRGTKFSYQRTKEKLEFFQIKRSTAPELYEKRDPFLPEMQKLLKSGVVLPHFSEDVNYFILRWGAADEDAKLSDIFKMGFLMFDIFVKDSNSYLATGVDVIADMRGFNLNFLQLSSLKLFEKVSANVFKGYPLRINSLNVYNSFPGSKIVFNFIKHLMSNKLVSRICFHDDEFNCTKTTIPLSALPKEFGGEGDTIDEIIAQWKDKIENYKEWFLEDEKFRIDKKILKEKTNTNIEHDDFEGSFKKLEID